MARPVVTVRRVAESMHTEFIQLWIEHKVEMGFSVEAATRLALDGTLTAALSRPDVHALLALVDGTPSGYVVISDSTRSLLVDSPCVSVDMLFVLADRRRTGVARALLAATTRYAERQGCELIASSVPAQDRDTNRYFARLGFAPETVRRVVSASALQRRLASGTRPRKGLDAVLARRRDLRQRAVATSATATPLAP